MAHEPDPPANDDEEYAYGELGCSFDKLIEALAANGAEVERGLITDEGDFLTRTND